MSSECHRILVEMKRQELVMERDALLSQIAQRRCYFPLHSGSGAVRRNFSTLCDFSDMFSSLAVKTL